MCNTLVQKYTGSVLYILGLLIAGGMMLGVGSEYNKDTPDNDDMRNFFWIYFVALLLVAIGMVLEFGDSFCSGGKNLMGDGPAACLYFAGLFVLVGFFALSTFGMGFAIYFDDSKYSDADTSSQMAGLGFLSGAASIFIALGSIMTMGDLLCCTGKFACNFMSAVSFTNLFCTILLAVFFFLIGDKYDGADADMKDDLRTYYYLVGVIFVIMGLIGLLKPCFFAKSSK